MLTVTFDHNRRYFHDVDQDQYVWYKVFDENQEKIFEGSVDEVTEFLKGKEWQ